LYREESEAAAAALQAAEAQRMVVPGLVKSDDAPDDQEPAVVDYMTDV